MSTSTISKAAVTTHILNLDAGEPAAGVTVLLFNTSNNRAIARAVTNIDGRIEQWDNGFALSIGVYCLQFLLDDWFKMQSRSSFYPEVQVVFRVDDTAEHYHIPLLLNAFGYSTYRGS